MSTCPSRIRAQPNRGRVRPVLHTVDGAVVDLWLHDRAAVVAGVMNYVAPSLENYVQSAAKIGALRDHRQEAF
jgi:hypothetical protein